VNSDGPNRVPAATMMLGVLTFGVLTLGMLVMTHVPRPLARHAVPGFTTRTASNVTTSVAPDIHHFNARRARCIATHPEHMLLRRIGMRRYGEHRDGCQHKQNRGWP
jgi:hypothetical protein